MATLQGLPIVGWFSCDYLAAIGTTDGTQITTWPNIAPGHEGEDFVGTTGPTFRSNEGGRPALEFMGNTPTLTWAPSTEVWQTEANEGMFVLKSTGAGAAHDLHNFGGYAGDLVYTDGLVRDDFASSAAIEFTPTMTTAAWRRYNAWGAPDDRAIYIDEVLQASSSSNEVIRPATGNGLGNTGGSGFNGWYSAVLAFNRKLTPAERARAVNWLQTHPGGGIPLFVYEAPPCRNFPRDDRGRNRPAPKSRQNSLRGFGYY